MDTPPWTAWHKGAGKGPPARAGKGPPARAGKVLHLGSGKGTPAKTMNKFKGKGAAAKSEGPPAKSKNTLKGKDRPAEGMGKGKGKGMDPPMKTPSPGMPDAPYTGVKLPPTKNPPPVFGQEQTGQQRTRRRAKNPPPTLASLGAASSGSGAFGGICHLCGGPFRFACQWCEPGDDYLRSPAVRFAVDPPAALQGKGKGQGKDPPAAAEWKGKGKDPPPAGKGKDPPAEGPCGCPCADPNAFMPVEDPPQQDFSDFVVCPCTMCGPPGGNGCIRRIHPVLLALQGGCHTCTGHDSSDDSNDYFWGE